MPGISLADRSMFVRFFSEETDWRSGLYAYPQKNSHNFPYSQKINRLLFAHWRRQGLKLLIRTFKRSQLVVVGYHRTTGEFFLVSANSSSMVLYNMRLGWEGGKENALFLQAVSISFHNETTSMSEGSFGDFTANYHILQKSIISEAKEKTQQSPEEKWLYVSPHLWQHFSLSACLMQLLLGAHQM